MVDKVLTKILAKFDLKKQKEKSEKHIFECVELREQVASNYQIKNLQNQQKNPDRKSTTIEFELVTKLRQWYKSEELIDCPVSTCSNEAPRITYFVHRALHSSA